MSARSPRWTNRLLAILAWAVIAAVVGAMLLGAVQAFAKPRVVPAGTRFICTPTAVWDGDGPIWCAEGPRLRLANIDARELDGSCRRRGRCVAASGIAARDGLVALFGGSHGIGPQGHVLVKTSAIMCRSKGTDRYARTLAECRTGGHDIGKEMIRRGLVAAW